MANINIRLRSVALIVLIVAVLGSGGTAAAEEAEAQHEYLPNEVLVKLYDADDLKAVAAAHGLNSAPIAQFGARSIYRLAITDGSSPVKKATALTNDGRVQYAEPNYLGQTPEGRQRYSWTVGDDAGQYAEQWAPETMRLAEAHVVTRGADVTVAILDTGVDATHPVLQGKLRPGRDFVDLDDDPSEVGIAGEDVAYGHGTHVAGLVALAAPEATIMPIRVLDRNGTGNIWVLAEALKYAIDPDGKPNTDDGADVINLSLSTTRRTNLLAEIVGAVTCNEISGEGEEDGEGEECKATGSLGVVVVAAAGNQGSSTPEYPAGEGVAGSLAVGASTEDDQPASFSNRGTWVDVLAPGTNIVSSVPGGGYGVWSGTSMAAPLTAGEAALVRARYPDLTAPEVADHVGARSRSIGDGRYRIDVAAALGVK